MTYPLKVTQQWKIVMVLICCPLFSIGVFLSIVIPVRHIPEWAIWTAVFILLGFTIATTLLIITRWLNVVCRVELSDQGMHFELLRQTPFMRIHHFSCNWANVKNISANEDNYTDTLFYYIEFKKPNITLSLVDIPETSIEKTGGSDFWKALNKYIELHNAHAASPEMRIHHIGFYQQMAAKVFTTLVVISGFMITLAGFLNYGKISWSRIASFWVLASPWLWSYYRAMKTQKDHPAS